MNDTLCITGTVATEPRHSITTAGLEITSFRLASTARRFDREKREWIDGHTNWYTVSAYRQLARHAQESIRKGERVIVMGRLRIREWENGQKTGMAVEIDADAVGHDLLFGTSTFTRAISRSESAPSAAEEAVGDADAAISDWPSTVPASEHEPVPTPF
ncbi:single-stranded DNA-binding protein [Ruicaihuangia caeni]|uniref:single-stranded DNA-binding protein n=1 Tax=Ruicaihuangia caeni TaxID=3042517 RepID=UPI00338F30E6